MTYEEFRATLMPDEFDYDRSDLGIESMPYLVRLIREDPLLGSRATHLAGRLKGLEAIELASRQEDTDVRTAAAVATQFFPPDVASSILERLVGDSYYGTRKAALHYTPAGASEALIVRIKAVHDDAEDPTLRKLARKALELNHAL